MSWPWLQRAWVADERGQGDGDGDEVDWRPGERVLRRTIAWPVRIRTAAGRGTAEEIPVLDVERVGCRSAVGVCRELWVWEGARDGELDDW